MIWKLSLVLALVFSLALTTPALAQGTPEAELDGLESAYGRIYLFDPASLTATPGTAEAMDPATIPVIGRTAVYTFEDTAAAEANLEPLSAVIAVQASEGASVEKEEIDDLGDAAYQFTAEVEPEPGMITGMTLYMVQDGPLVLLAAVVGGEDPTGMVRSWIELMLDREVSEEAIELKDDGTSTGGVFALMPTADDAAQLGGMVPITDIDLLDTSGE